MARAFGRRTRAVYGDVGRCDELLSEWRVGGGGWWARWGSGAASVIFPDRWADTLGPKGL